MTSPQGVPGSLRVDGLRLAFEIHGSSGPLLVFLPGIGFPRTSFRPMAAFVADRARCVLLDPRGAGESEGPTDPMRYAIDVQAEDVIALLEELGEQRAFLVGHSLGSNVAIACAARHPDRVEGVLVISASLAVSLIDEHLQQVLRGADPEARATIEQIEAQGPVFVGAGPPPAYAAAASRIYQPHVTRSDVPAGALDGIEQAVAPAAALWGEHSAFRVTGLLRTLDQRELVGTLTCPLVAVAGADDAFANTSFPFFERAPRGRVVKLSGSLHHAHLEEPARVAEILLETLFPRAADATPPLRLEIKEEDDGDVLRLTDELTEFTFALPREAGPVLRALGRPRAELVAALAASLDDGSDADALGTAVDELTAQLSELGLLQEGRSRAAIAAAQKRSRSQSRVAERFADVVTAITHAYERVPLHRERMRAAGVSPSDLFSPDGLQRIPPLTKAEVRRHFPDGLVARGVDVQQLLADGAITIGSTSGTSEERLQVLFDWAKGGLPERVRELWDLKEDQALQRGAVFTTPLCAGFECHLGSSTTAERTRGTTLTLNSTADLFSLRDEEVRAVATELAAHKPDVLFLHPWYGVWLLQRAKVLGCTLHRPNVVISSYQLLTRRHRKLLADGFGAPVFSYWGATDLGGPLLGVQCHRGNLHVREDQVFLEIEHPNAQGRGTLLVTLLHDPVMPLVRYRISDVARLVDEPCSCAIGGEWQTVELFGRARDCVAAVDGRVLTTRDIDDALGEAGPDFWRFTQVSASSYRLDVIGVLRDETQASLLALLGAGAQLQVVQVKRFAAERSLKFRQTMSELGSPLLVAG